MERERIAIIGVGLLGGSLALSLKRRGARLIGWNHRASSRRKAAKLLPVASTLGSAVDRASTVVLCAHSGSIVKFLKTLLPWLAKGALVMDVSSVKSAVVKEASKVPRAKDWFVPCHPMAGKEKSGPGNADPFLYQGRIVFITPLRGTSKSLVRRAEGFWRKVGALPIVLPASLHDRSVALTSHLPHLLACALMTLFGSREKGNPFLHKAVGTGFRDFTRLAGGSPAMWSDIMRMNASEIASILSEYRRILGSLETRLRQGKSGTWMGFFEKARTRRDDL